MYKYKIVYVNGTSEVIAFDKRNGIGSISEFVVDTNKIIPIMGYKKII